MSGKMKIAQITSVHKKHDVRIFQKQCTSLKAAGYDVVLVACSDSDEVVNNVPILAIPHRSNRRDRILKSPIDIFKTLKAVKPDVVHFHDPELIPLAILLRLKGAKVIYDVHEDIPEQILSKFWINKYFRVPTALLFKTLETLFTRFVSAAVICATPKIAERFPTKKTKVVQNFPVLSEAVTAKPQAWELRRNRVVYAGGLTRVRGLIQILDAIASPELEAYEFTFCGPFYDKKFEQECMSHASWNRVNYIPWIERTELNDLLLDSKVGLVLFHPLPNHINAQPNKLFEYMSCGLPFLCSNFPFWEQLLEEHPVGISADPMNPAAIADGMLSLLTNAEYAKKCSETRSGARCSGCRHFLFSPKSKPPSCRR